MGVIEGQTERASWERRSMGDWEYGIKGNMKEQVVEQGNRYEEGMKRG